MRLASLLIWTSVVVVSANDRATAHGAIQVESSRAGGSVEVSFFNEEHRRVKLRTTVKRRDGSRTELPSIQIENPQPGARIEGPVLPADSGGGMVIVEAFDADTGERLGKDNAPIGF